MDKKFNNLPSRGTLDFIVGRVSIFMLTSLFIFTNEIFQQSKRLYYTLRKIDFERVHFDQIDSDTYFDILSGYFPKTR